jgi:hypothetical protein
MLAGLLPTGKLAVARKAGGTLLLYTLAALPTATRCVVAWGAGLLQRCFTLHSTVVRNSWHCRAHT